MPTGSELSPSFSRRISFPSQFTAFPNDSGVNCLSKGSAVMSSTLNPLAFMADGLNQVKFRSRFIIHTMSVMCSARRLYRASLFFIASSVSLWSVISREIPWNPIGLPDEFFCKDIDTSMYLLVPSFLIICQSNALAGSPVPVSYTHLRAHETRHDLVCRLLLEKKKI